MNTDKNLQDDWTPCPAGTLTGLKRRLHRTRRAERAWRLAAQASVLLVVVAAVWVFTQTGGGRGTAEYDFGGITCTEVHRLLPKYMQGEVEPTIAEKIKLHLAECPRCQELVRQMGPQLMPQTSASRPAGACPHCGMSPPGWSLAQLEMRVAALLLR